MTYESSDTVSVMEPGLTTVQNALVTDISGKRVLIDMQGCIEEAKTAFSCLVQPLPGDLVVCTRNDSGQIYILGILERYGDQSSILAFPSNGTIISENGSLGIVSNKSVTITAGESYNCITDTTLCKSNKSVIDFKSCTVQGDTLDISCKSIRLISQLVFTMARQCISKVKSYMRHTEEYDQVKAGQMIKIVEGLYSLDSKHTVMVSKKDTKIDGERIHMG